MTPWTGSRTSTRGRFARGYAEAVANDDERIAVFLDYKNLAIGALSSDSSAVTGLRAATHS